MGKVKNISGETRTLLGNLVLAGPESDPTNGQVLEVPDDVVFAATQSSTIWAPDDDATTVLHETGELEQRVRQIVADEAAGVPITYPAEDAERVEVAAFVVVTDQASVEDLAGKSVEDLHAEYETGSGDPVEDSGPPAKNATRDAWAAYAATQGATAEDIEGKTRAELIEAYGAREVEGQLVEGAGERGPAVNTETGVVTPPGESLPPAESDGSGEPLDPPIEHDPEDDPSEGTTTDSEES